MSLCAEESKKLEGSGLSIICLMQRKQTCLLLGPARFINHDCNPNCALVLPRRNSNKISVRVIRPIEPGTELTVYYGKNYFSLKNRECMCLTCEKCVKQEFTFLFRNPVLKKRTSPS